MEGDREGERRERDQEVEDEGEVDRKVERTETERVEQVKSVSGGKSEKRYCLGRRENMLSLIFAFKEGLLLSLPYQIDF